MLKPAPVTDAVLIVTAAVPVEVNVRVCVADVLRFTVPKAMVVAFTLKVGVPELMPWPGAAVVVMMDALADCVLSCVDVAVQLPVPAADGVNTPDVVMVPPIAVHVTAVLKLPLPETVAEQMEV